MARVQVCLPVRQLLGVCARVLVSSLTWTHDERAVRCDVVPCCALCLLHAVAAVQTRTARSVILPGTPCCQRRTGMTHTHTLIKHAVTYDTHTLTHRYDTHTGMTQQQV